MRRGLRPYQRLGGPKAFARGKVASGVDHLPNTIHYPQPALGCGVAGWHVAALFKAMRDSAAALAIQNPLKKTPV